MTIDGGFDVRSLQSFGGRTTESAWLDWMTSGGMNPVLVHLKNTDGKPEGITFEDEVGMARYVPESILEPVFIYHRGHSNPIGLGLSGWTTDGQGNPMWTLLPNGGYSNDFNRVLTAAILYGETAHQDLHLNYWRKPPSQPFDPQALDCSEAEAYEKAIWFLNAALMCVHTLSEDERKEIENLIKRLETKGNEHKEKCENPGEDD